MKYNYSDFLEGECSFKDYLAQWNMEKPEVGGRYVVEPNTWMQSIVRCVHVDDRVALLVEEESCSTRAGSKGGYSLYNLNGTRYNHSRMNYRLQNIDLIK